MTNKKSKLGLLVKNGINKKINTKWFKIINLILLILIPVILNIDTVIKVFGGDFDDPITVYVVDPSDKYYESIKDVYENTTATM